MGILSNLFKSFGGGTGVGTGTSPAPLTNSGDGREPEFDEDFADFVNTEYTTRQSERRSFELGWRLNSEFIDGNQYLDINPVSHTLEEVPKLNWWSEREVFNQIATIVETRIAKVARQKPMLKTRPASSDDVDVSAAKITSMLLSATWHDQLMDEQYEDLVSWMEITGTAFIKVAWNKNKGRVVISAEQLQQLGQQQQQQPNFADNDNPGQPPSPETPETPEMGGLMANPASGLSSASDGYGPEADDDPANERVEGITKLPRMADIREGDIDTIIVPPHEIFPDSSYRRGIRDCRSIIHAKAYHIQEVAEIWGVEVDPEDVDILSLQRMSASMGGLGYGYGSVRTTARPVKNHVIVKEYYERPTIKYPKGRFLVVAGKKTLYAGPLPYQLGKDGEVELPIARVVSIDRPGCFWGKSVIDRCIPIQRRYNALRNRKAEYLNMVAIGQWYSPIGSLDEGTELSNAPGNIIHYRPGLGGHKPEPVQWPSLPNSFEMEESNLMHEFTSVSGISELARFSGAPAGVRSGVALAAAVEQDNTRVATTVSRVANGITDMGQKWIRLYRQFVQEPRLLRFVGGNREADLREWERSDLRSDDVFIENMAALAETPSQRRKMVFDLLNAGMFTRPELSPMTEDARQKVFQLLEFGHWETGDEDEKFLHKSRARRENNDIMEGKPVEVMDFDDHIIHVDMHNRQRMQAEYDELLKTQVGQVANQIMMMHIAQHIQLALQSMPTQPVAGEPAGGGGGKPASPAEKPPSEPHAKTPHPHDNKKTRAQMGSEPLPFFTPRPNDPTAPTQSG